MPVQGATSRRGQIGRNVNGTKQTATSRATTDQANVYGPTVVYCNRCFNGNVTQTNSATTTANSANTNTTTQGSSAGAVAPARAAPRWSRAPS